MFYVLCFVFCVLGFRFCVLCFMFYVFYFMFCVLCFVLELGIRLIFVRLVP